MAGKDKGGKGGKDGKGATKDAKKGGAASKAKKKEEKPLPIVLTPWQGTYIHTLPHTAYTHTHS